MNHICSNSLGTVCKNTTTVSDSKQTEVNRGLSHVMLCVKELYSTRDNFPPFPSVVLYHLRTEYIHFHLVFPANYPHTEECSCDQ